MKLYNREYNVHIYLETEIHISEDLQDLFLLVYLVLPFDSGVWADAVVEHKVP